MEKFVLPELWCVKATTHKEDKVLTDYVNKRFTNSKAKYDGKEIINTWFTNKDLGNQYYTFASSEPFNTTEITYEQFLKYVLNHDIEIPEEQPEDNTELNEILIKLLS